MIIKKLIAFILMGHFFSLCSSAPAASSSSSAISQQEYTFIVMLKNTEDVIGRKQGLLNVQTYQQAQICCPSCPEALNKIKTTLTQNDRIKIENQIELSSIVKPILPIIKQYLARGITNRRDQGFMVGPNQSVIPGIFDLQAVTNFRFFKLENDPIPQEWFAAENF